MPLPPCIWRTGRDDGCLRIVPTIGSLYMLHISYLNGIMRRDLLLFDLFQVRKSPHARPTIRLLNHRSKKPSVVVYEFFIVTKIPDVVKSFFNLFGCDPFFDPYTTFPVKFFYALTFCNPFHLQTPSKKRKY